MGYEDMKMPELKSITATLITAFASCFLVSGSVEAVAESPVQLPSPAMSSMREPEKSVASLEARHRDRLAFIQRHRQSCDPWETPSCGHVIGYVRPISCVAP